MCPPYLPAVLLKHECRLLLGLGLLAQSPQCSVYVLFGDGHTRLGTLGFGAEFLAETVEVELPIDKVLVGL